MPSIAEADAENSEATLLKSEAGEKRLCFKNCRRNKGPGVQKSAHFLPLIYLAPIFYIRFFFSFVRLNFFNIYGTLLIKSQPECSYSICSFMWAFFCISKFCRDSSFKIKSKQNTIPTNYYRSTVSMSVIHKEPTKNPNFTPPELN